LISKIRRLLSSDDGPTAAEYALMLGFIVLTIVTVVSTLGTTVSGSFSTVSSLVQTGS